MFFNAPLLLPASLSFSLSLSLSVSLACVRRDIPTVGRSEIGTARLSRAVAASSAIVSAMRNVMTQFDPPSLPSHSRRRAPCAGNIAAGFERVLSCGLLSLSQRAGAYERVRACRLLSFTTLPPLLSPRRSRCFEQFSPGTNQAAVPANTSRAYSAR